MPAILVLDFDGTVTLNDVGDAVCDRLAPPAWREWDARWVRGELSLPDAQREMWALARASREAAVEAARSLGRLRPGLDALLAGVHARGGEAWLASGGFDFYIEPLLGAHLARFRRAWFNRVRFDGDRLCLEFPHHDLACDRCAVCKGRVCDLARRSGAARVVFAGDGHSDRHALGRADAVAVVRGSTLAREARDACVHASEFDALDELLPLLDE
jgi:2-hydroxy-3-keto-5-methylthiopentenyl-1-phosphate phosphatase